MYIPLPHDFPTTPPPAMGSCAVEEDMKSALIREQGERLETLRARVSRYRTLLRAEREKVKELQKQLAGGFTPRDCGED